MYICVHALNIPLNFVRTEKNGIFYLREDVELSMSRTYAFSPLNTLFI